MLNSEQRQVFATLAETLIPASDTMPSATTAEVSGILLDQVVGYRPDLVDALTAAMDSSVGKDPEAALDSLSAEQPEQFEALTVLAAGAYFLSPAVKAAMPYDAAPRPARDDMDSYVDMLEHVVDRGFVIRSSAPTSHLRELHMSETRSKSAGIPSPLSRRTPFKQVPLDQRHGRNRDMFTIWFGANIMILAIVTGALATTLFGQPAWAAALAIVLGNLFGAIFMALHSAQGPTLGVPQMVANQRTIRFVGCGTHRGLSWCVCTPASSSRSWCSAASHWHRCCRSSASRAASSSWRASASPRLIWGYTLIHAYARIMTWASYLPLVLAFVWAFVVHPMLRTSSTAPV